MLSDRELWDVADALGMTLRVSGGRVNGKVTRQILLGWLRVDVPLRIVSSLDTEDGLVVLARSLGDLGVFAVRTSLPCVRVEVALLDLARLPKPTRLFERHKPADVAAVDALIADAEVKRFRKVGTTPWRELVTG